MSKGGVVESAKKEERYEAEIMKILEVLVQDRKTNDTKSGVVEARLNNLEAGINTIITAITYIKTQMDQVQQKIDEDKKAATRMADINKKWVAKQKMGAECSSGAQTGACSTPSGPLQALQWAATEPAEAPATKDALMRHNGLYSLFSQRGSLNLRSNLSTS